jgi:sulfur-carrier protein
VLTVRYFAAARAAAGVPEEKLPPESAPTLGALRAELARVHGDRMANLMPAVSFLVDGVSCRGDEVALPDDATVDVLPPFAGG